MTFKTLREDIDSIIARDPAARSRWEVVLCYPGFQAILLHRMAHGAWRRGWRLTGRWLSQLGRWLTGIEIHPGAKIGSCVFIDHGMGVVIGETAEIGDDCWVRQGVTIGRFDRGRKRPPPYAPRLGNGVEVGVGAVLVTYFGVSRFRPDPLPD